jgi:hypothetical protein
VDDPELEERFTHDDGGSTVAGPRALMGQHFDAEAWGAKQIVSVDGGAEPVWRGDGRELSVVLVPRAKYVCSTPTRK